MDVTEEMVNPFKTILDRLDTQDAMLVGIRADHERLMERWSESAQDRAMIHARLDAAERERARLVEQAQVYRDAMEVRIQAVESRDAITEIRKTVVEIGVVITELVKANAFQLAVHRWWTKRSNRIGTVCGGAATIAIATNIVPLLRLLGHALLHLLGAR